MRPKFRETLETYGHIAKGEMAPEKDERLADVKDWNLDFAADEHRTSKQTQEQVFDLQKKKQKIMQRLKQKLKNLDNPDYKPHFDPGSRKITADGEKLFCQMPKGEMSEVTFGEILTDVDWGIEYFLDPESVPRQVKKKYLVEKAKHQLQDLLDRQIILSEVDREGLPASIKNSYEQWLLTKEKNIEKAGLIAEQMVKNFLRKIAFDHDVDFKIEQADIFQDVNQKVDFIIRRKSRYRGVQVDTTDEELGIQFTIRDSQEALSNKQRQIVESKKHQRDEKYFEDIILVSLPLMSVMDVYRSWRDANKPAGGPDKMWDQAIKKRIFNEVMKDILTPEEIKENWQRIAPAPTVDKRKAA